MIVIVIIVIILGALDRRDDEGGDGPGAHAKMIRENEQSMISYV